MSKDGLLYEPVLTLNANFEPLHVCSTRRALMLIYTGKADIILNGRGKIHSSSEEFEIPSVIKLGHMIKRPRSRIPLSKREILRRDNFTCQYCGHKTHTLTLDHIVPRHQGGRQSWENLVAACASCNRRKGGQTPEKANMPLLKQPIEPKPSAIYRFGRHLEYHKEWVQFIEGW
jgi:5-methylcytosine-specific restriction endonuclease McrA